jgi:hypothetical protein
MRLSRPVRSLSTRRARRPRRACLTPALALSLGLVVCWQGSARAAEEPSSSDVTIAPAAPVAPRFANGGDFGGYLVERFGGLVLPNATRGQSGGVTGSGLEVRYMMPVGWGAYFRYARAVQGTSKCGDSCGTWDQWDLTFGFSKRLQATPQKQTFREHTRLDLGLLYSQAGTRSSCSSSPLTWSISCDSGKPSSGLNISGAAIGVEARLGLEVAVGPIGLGIDFGGAAFKSMTQGGNSDALPSIFFAWSAQARAGLAWTIE